VEVRVLFWAPGFPLSKLFDQLKKAAGSREQKSPGLLLEALQKAASAAGPDRPTAEVAPAPIVASEPPVAPARASAQSEPVAPGAATPQRAGAQYSGIALAILIFAVAVLAWHAVPWRAPTKVKIDPSELKLDRNLDLKRPSSEGTTAPRRPS
jgi:hypothetical protein